MCESEHLRDEVAFNPPVMLEFKCCLSQISWDLYYCHDLFIYFIKHENKNMYKQNFFFIHVVTVTLDLSSVSL